MFSLHSDGDSDGTTSFKTSPFAPLGVAVPACPHCHERFRLPPSLQVAKLLPCGHCVCEACLRVIIASTTPFCPVCNNATPLPAVEHMLTNSAMALYAEDTAPPSISSPRALPPLSGGRVSSTRRKLPQRSTAPKFCDDCRKFDASLREIAAFSCSTCVPPPRDSALALPGEPYYVCKADIRRHEKMRHTVAPLDMVPELRRDCTEHPGSQLFFFCITCSKLVCRDCVVLSHPSAGGGHDIRDLRSSLPDLRDILTGDRQRSVEGQDKLKLGLVAVTKAKETLRVSRTQAMIKIDDVFERLMQDLRQRQNEMKRDLDMMCDSRMKYLQHMGTVLLPSMAQLKCNEDLAGRCIDSDDPLTIAYALESVHVMNRLTRLADGLDCPESFDFACNEPALRDSIRQFGLVRRLRFDRGKSSVRGLGIRFFVRTFDSSVTASRSMRSQGYSHSHSHSQVQSSVYSHQSKYGTSLSQYSLSQGTASVTSESSHQSSATHAESTAGSRSMEPSASFMSVYAVDNQFVIITTDSDGSPIGDYGVEDVVVDITAKMYRTGDSMLSFVFNDYSDVERKESSGVSLAESLVSAPKSVATAHSRPSSHGGGGSSSKPSSVTSSRDSSSRSHGTRSQVSLTDASGASDEDKASVTSSASGRSQHSRQSQSTQQSEASKFSHSRAPFHRTLSAGPRRSRGPMDTSRPQSATNNAAPQSTAVTPAFSPLGGRAPAASVTRRSDTGSFMRSSALGSSTAVSIPVDIACVGLGVFEVTYRIDPSTPVEVLHVAVSVAGEPLAGSPFSVFAGIGGTHMSTLRVPGGYGLAVTHDGSLVVVHARGDRALMVVRTADGAVVHEFGSRGSARGQFDTPFCLCATKNNHILVTDCGNNRVQEVTLNGECVRTIGEDRLQDPYGVCTWGDLIAVSEYAAHRVSLFRTDGSFVRCFGSEGSGFGQLNFPMGLRFTPDGRHIAVADQGNGRVSVFNALGGFVRFFGHGILANPYDVQTMPSGQLLVADLRADRVFVFTIDDGELIAEIGTRGEEPGNFCSPSCLAVANDSLYVLDSATSRVQIFI